MLHRGVKVKVLPEGTIVERIGMCMIAHLDQEDVLVYQKVILKGAIAIWCKKSLSSTKQPSNPLVSLLKDTPGAIARREYQVVPVKVHGQDKFCFNQLCLPCCPATVEWEK